MIRTQVVWAMLLTILKDTFGQAKNKNIVLWAVSSCI